MDELEIDAFANSVVYWEEPKKEEPPIEEEAPAEVEETIEEEPKEEAEDISFLCGRYLAVARKMERELATLGRYERSSLAEELFDFFPAAPGKCMALCQKQVVDTQILLRSLERPELTEEMDGIFPRINVRSLQTRKLDMQLFIHGYHKQLAT